MRGPTGPEILVLYIIHGKIYGKRDGKIWGPPKIEFFHIFLKYML